MLDFVEETFDQVPLLVQVAVIFPLFFAVLAGWDHRFGFFLRNLLQEIIRIIRAIRNHPLKIKIGNQVIGLGDIMLLPAGQKKPQRVAQGIYTGVYLGAEPSLEGEPAPAASERLAFLSATFFAAPAAQGWARTTVLSSKIFSMSGSVAKC
jgi:hypothetical protein